MQFAGNCGSRGFQLIEKPRTGVLPFPDGAWRLFELSIAPSMRILSPVSRDADNAIATREDIELCSSASATHNGTPNIALSRCSALPQQSDRSFQHDTAPSMTQKCQERRGGARCPRPTI